MRHGTTVLRYNGKWTQSERRGYKTPAMERLEQEREEALKRKQQEPPDPEDETE
jgi:hypothetical protein